MRVLTITALIAALAVLVVPALAGPPLVCHPFDVAGHETLPWGTDAFETHGTYPIGSVVPATLARLAPDTPVIVRMETLRRAAIYLRDDVERRGLLLGRLQQRILDAEAAGRADALAWFDAGFLVQVYDQFGAGGDRWESGDAFGVAGYGWVRKALAMKGDDPQMEFAAAMMTLMGPSPHSRRHLERARRSAADDALLARNMERLMPVFDKFQKQHRRSG